jgi:hypothetical protein
VILTIALLWYKKFASPPKKDHITTTHCKTIERRELTMSTQSNLSGGDDPEKNRPKGVGHAAVPTHRKKKTRNFRSEPETDDADEPEPEPNPSNLATTTESTGGEAQNATEDVATNQATDNVNATNGATNNTTFTTPPKARGKVMKTDPNSPSSSNLGRTLNSIFPHELPGYSVPTGEPRDTERPRNIKGSYTHFWTPKPVEEPSKSACGNSSSATMSEEPKKAAGGQASDKEVTVGNNEKEKDTEDGNGDEDAKEENEDENAEKDAKKEKSEDGETGRGSA